MTKLNDGQSPKKAKSNNALIAVGGIVIVVLLIFIPILVNRFIHTQDEKHLLEDKKYIKDLDMLDLSLSKYSILNKKYPHPIKGDISESLKCHPLSHKSKIYATGIRDELHTMLPNFKWIDADRYFYAVDNARNPKKYMLSVKLKKKNDPNINEIIRVKSDKKNNFVIGEDMGTTGNWKDCSCNDPYYCIKGGLN